MILQKKHLFWLVILTAFIVLGCQAPFRFSIPVTPSVAALSIEAKSSQGKSVLGSEKKVFTQPQVIHDILAILEQYKDTSKLRTFDITDDFDLCLCWQIAETGKPDGTKVYLRVKRPQQLIYSIERADQSKLTYVVTMSQEDAETFKTLLGI